MNFNERNNNGIANEVKFQKIFDKKMVKELKSQFQELLYSLFDNLKEDDYIECWQSKFKEKADIKIRINGNIKGISIKMGENNSVHQEHINGFSNYLLSIGVSNTVVNELRAYIFGIINGVQINTESYKKEKQQEIIQIKNALMDFYIKINLFIRFLWKGKETQLFDADAIIHGTPENFLWATKSEVLEYLINYPNDNSVHVKIGPLFIQCRNRNLNKNVSSMFAEEYIQVKWYSLKKDLYIITKNRQKRKNHILIDN